MIFIEKDDLAEMVARFIELAPRLKPADADYLLNWMETLFYAGGVPSNVKQSLKQNITEGDLNAMKHRLEAYVEKVRADGHSAWHSAGRLAVAKNMLNNGMSIETIIKHTGLTVDDVIELQREA